MHLYVSENESMLILAYPNNQKEEVDHFLYPIDFKNPLSVIGTHCLESRIAGETNDTAILQSIKTPQLIQDLELFKLESSTSDYFAKTLEKHKEFLDQSKVVQILNLYCVVDENILKCPQEDLIVEQRVATKDL